MAGNKRTATSAETDWMLASWEWTAAASDVHQAAVQVGLTPTKRRGVWRVTARLVDVVDGRVAGVRYQVSGEWPNAARVEFGGYINALLMQLDAQAPLPLWPERTAT